MTVADMARSLYGERRSWCEAAAKFRKAYRSGAIRQLTYCQ